MTDAAENRKQSILKPFARRRKGELEAIEAAATPAEPTAPRSAGDVRAELVDVCRQADATLEALERLLRRRADLIREAIRTGLIGPQTGKRALHRIAVDRAIGAHRLDQYLTGYRSPARARQTLETQIRVLLPPANET